MSPRRLEIIPVQLDAAYPRRGPGGNRINGRDGGEQAP